MRAYMTRLLNMVLPFYLPPVIPIANMTVLIIMPISAAHACITGPQYAIIESNNPPIPSSFVKKDLKLKLLIIVPPILL